MLKLSRVVFIAGAIIVMIVSLILSDAKNPTIVFSALVTVGTAILGILIGFTLRGRTRSPQTEQLNELHKESDRTLDELQRAHDDSAEDNTRQSGESS
jgi:uncharacterized membrane protein YgaE (UPF0421/DUF939 family)